MWVVVEDDLVDSCKAGDKILVTGVVHQRWKPLTYAFVYCFNYTVIFEKTKQAMFLLCNYVIFRRIF